MYTKTVLKNVWDCSVQGRLEKDLKIVPKSKDTKVKYTSEIVLSDLEKKNAEFIKMKREKEAKQGLNISTGKKPNKFGNLKKNDDRDR